MPLPPGLPPNLPQAGYGMPQVPQGMGLPGGGIPFNPSELPQYGAGPAPIGAPSGSDDIGQMLGGLPGATGGVAGDAVQEDAFVLPDPIDRKMIPDAKNREWLRKLEVEAGELITSGKSEREAGNRDRMILAWRKTFEGKNVKSGGPWAGSSKIIPPDMRAAIESINSRNMEALFASRETVRFAPRKPDDSEHGKALCDHLYEFFHSPEIDLRGRLTRAGLDTMVDAGVICDCFWRREKAKRRRRVRITNDILTDMAGPNTTAPIQFPELAPKVRINGKWYNYGQMAVIEQEVIVRNHFDFRFVNIPDFFMYPATARTVQESTIAGYDFWQTEDEVRRDALSGLYDQKAVDELFDKDRTKYEPFACPRPIPESKDPVTANNGGLSGSDSMGLGEGNEGDYQGYARYRFRKFWARMRDADDDKLFEDFLIIQEASSDKIVFLQSQPYDNLKRSMEIINIDPRVGGGFYPYGMVEKCLSSHEELTAIVQMGIDLAVLASTTIVPVDTMARRSAQDLVFRPGPQYWKEDRDGTIKQPITFPMVQNSYLPERAMLSGYIDKVTGVSDLLTGAGGGTGTATEANIQTTSAGIRSKPMLLQIVKFLTWLYNQYKELTYQYLEHTPGKSFAISLGPGRGFENVTLEMLGIEGALTAYCDALDPDVALRLQMAEKKLTLLMQSPFVQADISRQWQAIFDFIRDTDRSFNPAPTMGTLEEAKSLQMKQTDAEAQQQKAQQAEPKVPNIPPNVNVEYLAVWAALNPQMAHQVLGWIRQLEIAEGAGAMQQVTAKITGDAMNEAMKPDPPKPVTPIGAGRSGSSSNQNRRR